MNFSEHVFTTGICQVLAHTIPRFYQKTGLAVYFKAHIDKSDNEFKIDIGFEGLESPSEEIYLKFLQELKETEKIVQNYSILKNLHKYTTIEQLKTAIEQEAVQLAQKHQKQ